MAENLGIFSRLGGFLGIALVLSLSAVGCDQDVDDDGEPQSIEVIYNDTTAVVDLGTLTTVDLDGDEMVRLSDVVEAADLGVSLGALFFDFVAADGFRSGDRSTCVDTIPMPGLSLEGGYINPITRNLAWDEDLDMPGCVRVDDTAQLLASDVPLPSPTINVSFDGDTIEVDLSEATVLEFDGADHVNLQEVIELAELSLPLAELSFDFEGADGFRPGNSDHCADSIPLGGEHVQYGYINITTLDLSWDEEAGLPGCMNLDNLALIEATEAEPAVS